MFLFCLVFAMFCARLFICASWSPAGKGLTSWLSFVVSSVSLSLSHWYAGSGVVLDCIDSWSLQPYLLLQHNDSQTKQMWPYNTQHLIFFFVLLYSFVGAWSPWSPWINGTCSVTCGDGKHTYTRIRHCLITGPCTGVGMENKQLDCKKLPPC